MSKLNQKTGIDKELIRNAMLEYCKTRELSQSELATQTQVSAATISKMLKGNWKDIRDSIWRKVFLIVSDGIDLLIETRDHMTIKNLCKRAREKKMMIGLIGDTGVGKTTSLKTISRKPNTYYVAYDKTLRAKQFFAALLREMGIAFEGSIHDMVNTIANEMNTQPSPLLIIDESGKLTHNMILYLHVLRDKTNKNLGIVLAGMPYFKSNLIKQTNKQREGYAEFHRRINLWIEIEGLRPNEIEFYCHENGIADSEIIRELKRKKRFGDLVNEILLHKEEAWHSNTPQKAA